MSPFHVIKFLMELGKMSPYFAVGGGVLGWLAFSPTCTLIARSNYPVIGVRNYSCTNFILGQFAASDTYPTVVAVGGTMLGALAGVIASLILVYVFGMSKKELGVEE